MKIKSISLFLLVTSFTIIFGCGKDTPKNGGNGNQDIKPPVLPDWRSVTPDDTHFAFSSGQRFVVKSQFVVKKKEADFEPFSTNKFTHVSLFQKGTIVAKTAEIAADTPFCGLGTSKTMNGIYQLTISDGTGTAMYMFKDTIITLEAGGNMGVVPILPQNRSLYYTAKEAHALRDGSSDRWSGWVFCGVFSDKVILAGDTFAFQKHALEVLGMPKAKVALESFGAHVLLEIPQKTK